MQKGSEPKSLIPDPQVKYSSTQIAKRETYTFLHLFYCQYVSFFSLSVKPLGIFKGLMTSLPIAVSALLEAQVSDYCPNVFSQKVLN